MSKVLLSSEYKRFPKHWITLPFMEAFSDKTGGQVKIQKNNYLNKGDFPIIDQGQDLFGGFTNSSEAVCKIQLPCVLFGDHTKIFKYIDRPFVLGADGVKVLEQREDIDPKFAFYYLCTLSLPDVGYSRHFRFLKRTFFPLPPIAEQKRIAAILDKADAIRRKRKEAIRLTEELQRSLFLEMFGDPVTNPKGWRVGSMREAIKKIDAGWSANGEDKPLEDGEWGVLKISAVTTGQFISSECKNVGKPPFSKPTLIPKRGDLLFTRANTRELVAATCLVEEDHENIFLPDKIWNIRTDEAVVTREYLRFLLSEPDYRSLLTRKATGTSGSMLNVSQEKLLEMIAPIPPIEIQKKFSNFVWKGFSLRGKYELGIQNSDNLFNSLLQRAFRGEL